MMKTSLLALALFLSCAFALNLLDITPVAERVTSTSGVWQVERTARPNEEITFKILLKQRNLDQLETIFWEVSDPDHANYGKFLSIPEVKSLIAPEASAVKKVLEWIMLSGISTDSVAIFSDFLQVTTTVQRASKLFTAEFARYKSSKTNNARIRISGPAHIPSELSDAIDFVVGISELIEDTHKDARPNVGADNLVTPAVLKSYYGVPANAVGTNSTNLQGIAAFTDYFSYGALDAFDTHFSIKAVNVTRNGPDCLPDQCDQYESDLDVQYITAIGLGVPTTFLAHGDGEWILDWALQLTNDVDAPFVNSISYGWAELQECEITDGCQTYGYDSQQYVTRTNTELQVMGVRGISVMVSDGDDGAPSLAGSSGNCPMDPNVYCPTGGCAHTSSKCNELTFTLTSNNTKCFFPMGLGTDVCAGMLQDSQFNSALNAWAEANSKCKIAFDQDSDKMYHVYSACSCSDLKSHTADGFTIAAYSYDQSNGPIFTAEYPTSSPYVTSVGATQFTWSGNSVSGEVVCSIQQGARITTGGGFSTFQPQPSYQSAAVQSWIQAGDSLPPSSSYNPKMRAYPDVVFNGHNYLIYASTNNNDLDKCPCSSLPVDGTSCSSPAFSGLISLINDKVMNAGKSPLGFLNPLLYKMAAAQPSAFHDITSGNNKCNRAYCCEYGYQATKGWDPVGGLGSPVYDQFVSYILNAKGVAL